MSTVKPPTTQKSPAQRLEELRTRYQALSARRNRAEAEVSASQRQFKEAQDEAEREFGTGDVVKLRELYAQGEQDNETVVAEFAKAVDAYEVAIAEVERQLG